MFCEVYLLDVPYQLDRPFDYSCNFEISVGSIVRVPFGKANKLRPGVVVRLKETTEGRGIKPVHSEVEDVFTLTDEMRGLCSFLKEYTLCTYGEAVRCILPPGAFADKLNVSYRRICRLSKDKDVIASLLTVSGKGAIRSEGQRALLKFLLDNGGADYDVVKSIGGITSIKPFSLSALI